MFMTKKVAAAGLAALALIATTAAASAAPAFASSNVNVRSGPGTYYGVVDALRRGEQVDIQYCQGSWCFIEKRGPDGWVSANYLERGNPGRPDWNDGPDWGNGPSYPPPRPPRPPHWGGNGPGWGGPGPGPGPGWGNGPRPGPGWGNGPGPGPGWGNPRPPRPNSSVCFNGPNGYFCMGD